MAMIFLSAQVCRLLNGKAETVELASVLIRKFFNLSGGSCKDDYARPVIMEEIKRIEICSEMRAGFCAANLEPSLWFINDE